MATFVTMKVVFMLYNHDSGTFGFADIFSVIFHGLPQDLTTAGYYSIFPWLMCFISIWTTRRWLNKSLSIYSWFIAILLSLILVADCGLYSFWQFKLDATIYNYLDSPKDIVASVSTIYVIIGIFCVAILAVAIAVSLKRIGKRLFAPCKDKRNTIIAFLLAAGLMFLAIRGGVGRSTMNIGHVYYSSNPYLNHSAVNPAFSLMYSTLKLRNLDKLYHFYSDKECDEIYGQLHYSNKSETADTLLASQRPNIVLILMEGLGANFVQSLGGEAGITPSIDKLAKEGVSFTQCYANSFRTDRGTVCALSGYPAFPDISVMKMPEKSMDLPSIAKSLKTQGYSTEYVYGGDKNFTNANSYLLSTGYNSVMGDEDFPQAVRKTHSWGVTDNIVLDTLYQKIMRQPADSPFFITCQTLASHEDWKVPYDRIKNNPKANAMAYLDHSIGQLVEKLRKTPAWDNLLLILIPDHGITYPEGITEADIRRSHIPLIWAGGAVSAPREVTKICNQTDLPATLLGQLGISHDQFAFSRDVTSQTYIYPCAVHAFAHGLSFIDSTGVSIQDIHSGQMLTDTPRPSETRISRARAFLQKAVRDLSKK